MSRDLLIAYVKNPVPGQVKTRLIPVLGEEEAADLYADLLDNLSETLNEVSCDVLISYFDEFPNRGLSLSRPFSSSKQQGDDLGERMLNDFNTGFQKGYDKICLVGSDIPALNLQIIEQAYKSLDNSNLTFGPTFDGGYYLVGLQKGLNNMNCLFQNMTWSNAEVLQESLKQAVNNSLSISLQKKLEDIDEVHDLDNYYLHFNTGLRKVEY